MKISAAAILCAVLTIISCSNPFSLNSLTSLEKKVMKKISEKEFTVSSVSAEENGALISAARKFTADSQPEFAENILKCVNPAALLYPEDKMIYYYTRAVIAAERSRPGDAVRDVKSSTDECSRIISSKDMPEKTVAYARIFLADLYSFSSVLSRTMGRNDEALEYNENASAIYASYPDYGLQKQSVICYIMNTELYIKKKNFPKALLSLQKAEAIFNANKKNMDEKEWGELYSSFSTGKLEYMYQSGSFKQEEIDSYFETALDIAEKAESNKSLARIWLIKTNAAEKSDKGLELAFECIMKSLDYAKKSGDKILLAVVENKAAFTIDSLSHSGEYDGEKSIDHLRASLENFSVLMNSFTGGGELDYYYNMLTSSYERYIDLLVMEDNSDEALKISEKLRARKLRSLITRRKMNPESLLNDSFRKKIEELQGYRDYLLRQYMKSDLTGVSFNEEEKNRLLEKIRVMDSKISDVRTSAEKSSSGYMLVTQEPADISDAQDFLKDGQAVVIFQLRDNNTAYRWVIDNDGHDFKKIILAGSIQGMVKEIRSGLYSGSYTRSAMDNSSFIYNALFKDIVEDKKKKYRHLIIVPQSNMALVPYDAMITGYENGRPVYFLEKNIRLSISPSLTVFAMKRKSGREKFSQDFIGFADPNYSGIAPQLPNTVRETENAASFFKKSSVFIGDKALESRFKYKDTASYKYIHISTHGSVDGARNEPFVLFSQMSDPNDDGNLYAGEVYGMHLPAKFVTIAACMTGLGRTEEYEGVVGFTHAFFTAGTDQLALTLWSVETLSCELMFVETYRHLAAGMEPEEAMYRAKKTLMAKYGHPYYWAPYVHYY